VHLAGVTSGRAPADVHGLNVEGARAVATAARQAGAGWIHTSGSPGRRRPAPRARGRPIGSDHLRKVEQACRRRASSEHVRLPDYPARPLYGPGDRALFVFRLAELGVLPLVDVRVPPTRSLRQ